MDEQFPRPVGFFAAGYVNAGALGRRGPGTETHALPGRKASSDESAALGAAKGAPPVRPNPKPFAVEKRPNETQEFEALLERVGGKTHKFQLAADPEALMKRATALAILGLGIDASDKEVAWHPESKVKTQKS